MVSKADLEKEGLDLIGRYLEDWSLFASEVLGVYLDPEQTAVLRSVQMNKRTSVRSGTSRGKDFVAAVAAVCFFYLTPTYNEKGEMTGNTKCILTAPTERQVKDIMFAEVARIFNRAKSRKMGLAGKLSGYGIRVDDNPEWFLTGFKADDHNTESWTGFHAANTMFVVTEASAMPDLVFNAIEGNLHGNSRVLIVFNDNKGSGYASETQRSDKWESFRLNSLNAPNVLQKREVIPGQVSWDTINEQVKMWCTRINESDFLEDEGDFFWENEEGQTNCYRPDDLFRTKVLGLSPKTATDVLIPYAWIEAANKRWKDFKRVDEIGPKVVDHLKEEPQFISKIVRIPFSHGDGRVTVHQNIIEVPNPNFNKIRTLNKIEDKTENLRLGVDVAGQGRDSSTFCFRYKNFVEKFDKRHSGGQANHMEIAGITKNILINHTGQAFIDTIGEGAGVYSRLIEEGLNSKVHSSKFSESATDGRGESLNDQTGQREFINMRAYCYWMIRDWLNPAHKHDACLPVDQELAEELFSTKWEVLGNGKIKIEPKEDIKKRLKRSPDKADALALTFWPIADWDVVQKQLERSRQLAASL